MQKKQQLVKKNDKAFFARTHTIIWRMRRRHGRREGEQNSSISDKFSFSSPRRSVLTVQRRTGIMKRGLKAKIGGRRELAS